MEISVVFSFLLLQSFIDHSYLQHLYADVWRFLWNACPKMEILGQGYVYFKIWQMYCQNSVLDLV